MTTAATIATVGAAKLFVLLMTERDAAVPAIARGDVNVGFVNEFHDVSSFYSSLFILIWALEQKSPDSAGLFAQWLTLFKQQSHSPFAFSEHL
jgi:hypothetical protein